MKFPATLAAHVEAPGGIKNIEGLVYRGGFPPLQRMNLLLANLLDIGSFVLADLFSTNGQINRAVRSFLPLQASKRPGIFLS